jgi:hypothetical protein
MKKGMLFIPDISGFSRFVQETDTNAGATVVAELLEAIINANALSLEISEIEGDAVLFYRHGRTYPVSIILHQFQQMLKSFNTAKRKLHTAFPQVSSLSLKLIVHYGTIAMYSVKGFAKLYGKAVVEAHRLMKDQVAADTYVLVTDAYIQETGNGLMDEPPGSSQQCEIYGDLGKLCYTFFC